jgi:hypothetical protein
MNEFTPEYIELAKNSKVQGLRPELEHGDYYFYRSNNEDFQSFWATVIKVKKGVGTIWLPTGDQLDQEIIKICHSDERLFGRPYWQNYNPFLDNYVVAISGEYGRNFAFGENANPLIAKISLLIQLLEGE